MLFSFPFSLEVQAEKTDSGFPKNFKEDISLYLLNIFAIARSPKMKTKNFKNILVLAVVN